MKPLEYRQIPEEQGTPKVGYKRPPTHTRFKKGASGNPGGVKKGTVFISEAYKRILALPANEFAKFEPACVAEEIALVQVQLARGQQDSLPSAKEITDRTEGRAPQTINVNADVQIENMESRREWAERKLAEFMKSHRLSRGAAIRKLKAAGATKTLEYLGEL